MVSYLKTQNTIYLILLLLFVGLSNVHTTRTEIMKSLSKEEQSTPTKSKFFADDTVLNSNSTDFKLDDNVKISGGQTTANKPSVAKDIDINSTTTEHKDLFSLSYPSDPIFQSNIVESIISNKTIEAAIPQISYSNNTEKKAAILNVPEKVEVLPPPKEPVKPINIEPLPPKPVPVVAKQEPVAAKPEPAVVKPVPVVVKTKPVNIAYREKTQNKQAIRMEPPKGNNNIYNPFIF